MVLKEGVVLQAGLMGCCDRRVHGVLRVCKCMCSKHILQERVQVCFVYIRNGLFQV